MNTTIKTSDARTQIITGAVRILNEYGWGEIPEPKDFISKIYFIQECAIQGKAHPIRERLLYITEHTDDWGEIYSRVFVNGATTAFSMYGADNGWFKETNPDLTKVHYSVPSQAKNIHTNLFASKKEINSKSVLGLLKTYGNTTVRYSLYEKYGLDRILSDIQSAGYPKATVKVALDTHKKDQFYFDRMVDDHVYRIYIPIMPGVIIKTNEKLEAKVVA